MEGFPEHGTSWPELERLLVARRALEPDPVAGAAETYWPVLPPAAFHAAREAWHAYAHLNAFSTPSTPGFAAIDRELRTAVASLLRVPDPGQVVITAGGTEGNFLAVKAAREWARRHRPTARPAMALPRTAHPSFDKAGHELGVEVRRVAVDDAWRADPAALDAAIDDDCVLVVASLPSYPHGAVDDVPAVAALAQARGVWMHVDAAVGGFLAPHLRALDPTLPRFEADVPGVRSITADLHKLGFCLTGISTFSIARADDLAWPRFDADVWPHGRYVRQGFVGSRPAGIVAAAWAVIATLGREGYLDLARTVADRQQAAAAALEGLGWLRMVVPPRLGLLAAEPVDGTDVHALLAALAARGWHLAPNTEPPSVQVFATPALDVAALASAFVAAHADVASGREAPAPGRAYGEGS